MVSRQAVIAVTIGVIMIAGALVLLPRAIGEETDDEVRDASQVASTGRSQDDYDPLAKCGFDPDISPRPNDEQMDCLVAEKERYRREEGAPDPNAGKSWPIEIDPVTGKGCNTREQLLDMLETQWQADQEYIRLLEKGIIGIPKAIEIRRNYAEARQRYENMPAGSKQCFEMNGVTAEMSESGEITAKEYSPQP